MRSIAKSYDKRAVLHDVSLTVERGEVVGLLGPNGAGKTTCFYSVMGLVKPDSGRIYARRRGHHRPADVPPRDPRARLSAAGNLDLPRPDRRAEHPRVLEVVEPDQAMRARRGSSGCSTNSASPDLRDAPAMALSGGERRRCEIARALAANPSIMLLDEPFAGIDPISIADIRELVRDLKTARHRRADHRPQCPRDARHRRPRLHHLRRPGAVRRARPQALVADENVRRLYLGESFAL